MYRRFFHAKTDVPQRVLCVDRPQQRQRRRRGSAHAVVGTQWPRRQTYKEQAAVSLFFLSLTKRDHCYGRDRGRRAAAEDTALERLLRAPERTARAALTPCETSRLIHKTCLTIRRSDDNLLSLWEALSDRRAQRHTSRARDVQCTKAEARRPAAARATR
ncbi:hypothetical protein EVAR_16137_1 [Eumeta japonica]|uniref:Uncharacterized protein n=1 Tax=Eumeta variegata TaxID=151549 RepID=A0A4C1WDC1_EUMVA|nr:hypothetical protein EVAR_16137_1 [Eumeta japonica]